MSLTSDLKKLKIKNLVLDSRKVKPGDLFFACVGTHLDGRKFIDSAIANGAAAIISEGNEKNKIYKDVPIFFVPNLINKIGDLAAEFYKNPSREMQVIGITGTNGKTSCSHFIASALTSLNRSCGVIGTLGNGLYGNIQESNLTTPDAVTLQKTLSEFLNQGAKYTAMEVSSHSIEQGRINGTDFAASIFTNLTRDHLDYHLTMEHYANAKKKLFELEATKKAVINADDELGQAIISELKDKKPLFAYGVNAHQLPSNVPFVYAKDIKLDLTGITAKLHSPWGVGELKAKLIGQFNVSNLLAVFTTLCLLDIPFQTVLNAIEKLTPVAGRMQALGGGKKPLVLVDYSHTPDALENALKALRHHCQKKLFCVFGCGGDRDRGKRPMMAKIAEFNADHVIVTNDNPRTEDPELIAKEILCGFKDSSKVQVQLDRAKAIKEVIEKANSGDCILIAGKGAETYQIIGTEKFPFSDVDEVSKSL